MSLQRQDQRDAWNAAQVFKMIARATPVIQGHTRGSVCVAAKILSSSRTSSLSLLSESEINCGLFYSKIRERKDQWSAWIKQRLVYPMQTQGEFPISYWKKFKLLDNRTEFISCIDVFSDEYWACKKVTSFILLPNTINSHDSIHIRGTQVCACVCVCVRFEISFSKFKCAPWEPENK